MTIPATGPISRSMIENEFGLASTSIWPNDFFGKGGAPAARPLKFSDFHGLSGGSPFTPAPGSYSSMDASGEGIGDYFQITCTSPVSWAWTKTGATAGTADEVSGTTNTEITLQLPAASTTTTRIASFVVSTVLGGVTYNWSVSLEATGAGACVSTDSYILLATGSSIRAADLKVGDWVLTRHEKSWEWVTARVSAIHFEPATIYSRKNYPDASRKHRFGWNSPYASLLPTWLRWLNANWFGRKNGAKMVAKITIEHAHTYMARHPDSDTWRLCHNLKSH